MDYKKMIKTFADNGGSEAKMWESVEVTEQAMDYIKEVDPDKYECLMRKLSEALYGKHYDEEIALLDVAKMHSVDDNGNKRVGQYWTVEQVEAATAGKTFPKGTTKYDRYVAYNAFAHDLGRILEDEDILEAAYQFWFADEDWVSDGKIWDYMSINR